MQQLLTILEKMAAASVPFLTERRAILDYKELTKVKSLHTFADMRMLFSQKEVPFTMLKGTFSRLRAILSELRMALRLASMMLISVITAYISMNEHVANLPKFCKIFAEAVVAGVEMLKFGPFVLIFDSLTQPRLDVDNPVPGVLFSRSTKKAGFLSVFLK